MKGNIKNYDEINRYLQEEHNLKIVLKLPKGNI